MRPVVRLPARPPRPGRRLVTGGIVALIAAAGLTVSLGTILSRSATGPTTTPAGTTTSAAVGGSVCGLPGMDRNGATVTVAPATRWAEVGTMAAPTVAGAGPGRMRADGLHSCYAHTALGALLAVGNLWATASDPRLYRQILQANVAAGAGRTAALQLTGAPASTGESAQIAGFKVLSYAPGQATVDVALEANTGQLIGFPVPLVWQDGDWKVQLAGDGSQVFRPVLLASLAGYVPWAGSA